MKPLSCRLICRPLFRLAWIERCLPCCTRQLENPQGAEEGRLRATLQATCSMSLRVQVPRHELSIRETIVAIPQYENPTYSIVGSCGPLGCCMCVRVSTPRVRTQRIWREPSRHDAERSVPHEAENGTWHAELKIRVGPILLPFTRCGFLAVPSMLKSQSPESTSEVFWSSPGGYSCVQVFLALKA